jgi:dihydropteroate synthase
MLSLGFLYLCPMMPTRQTINCRGKLLSLEEPIVMGILNLSPDSFYDGGRYPDVSAVLDRVAVMLSEGAAIIDLGGMSSRPGAAIIAPEEEMRRVLPAISQIKTSYPDCILSIDTVHANVARAAVNAGASIINDISAGSIDPAMYATAASLGVPYVLMHMKGRPATMQEDTTYEDPVLDVLDFMIAEVGKLVAAGVKDIILDPGFGFGKTIAQNYRLLRQLHVFSTLPYPVLAGLSRKSMIYKALDISPAEALNGTSVLHMAALMEGAKILRAHDVREAVETIRLWQWLQTS